MSANPNADYLRKIAKRVLKGTASAEEKQFLDEYYNAFERHPDINSSLTDEEIKTIKLEIRSSIIETVHNRADQVIPLYKRKFFTIPVAAAILLFFSAALYFGVSNQPGHREMEVNTRYDFVPGGNKAVLILSDGSKINLDNAADGVIAKQAGLVITKTKEGQLVYDLSASSQSEGSGYNTIETPKGGQYQINLPDGSRVWLNASSTLKFPAVFSGKDRSVTLTGEGYFEVARDKKRPFRVNTRHQVVEVLGTHFNINSYNDEPFTNTTLLEGSVKIVSGNQGSVIKPGEQAQLAPGRPVNIMPADTEEAIAWKNGLFQFKDADIETIMRQVSRWYNVDVDYEGNIPNRVFSGKIYRNVNVSQVLDILSFTEIHFRIEKDRIIVTP